MHNVWNEKVAECSAYFKRKSSYARVMEAMAQKWKRYGRAAGIIRLEEPSTEEREALEGFLGDLVLESSAGILRFSMAGFEEALQRTRFQGIPLEDLLSAYLGETILSNRQSQEQKKRRRESFLGGLLKNAVDAYGAESRNAAWMRCLISQRKYGYHLLTGLYEQNTDHAAAQAEYVYRAAAFLEERPGIRMAVLGSEITGNPHQFDRNTDTGKLLIQALSFFNGGKPVQSAEDVLALYVMSGMKPDDISSFTTAYGIHLGTDYGLHPAYEGFIQHGESYLVSLSNLSRIKSVHVKGNIVYAVENQMVFSQLCEALEGREAGLLCTSGQVKTASLILLDLLCASGCKVLYCGDLDPEGISIAAKLVERGNGAVIPWHMTREDYEISISNECIGDKSRHLLERVQLSCLMDARDAVLEGGRAGYQEKLLDRMLADILQYSCSLEMRL